MAWNNANENGRFGPFSGGASGPLQTGLSSPSPTSPPAPVQSAPGVLPTPPAMVSAPGTGGGGGGSLAPQPGAASQPGNGAAMAMADGGVMPSDPSGTMDLGSALTVAQQALQSGRKQFALPPQLIGGQSGQSADGSSDEETNYANGKSMLEMKMMPGTTEQTVGKNVQTPGYTPGYGNASSDDQSQSFDDGGGVIPGAANPDEGLLLASQMQREAAQRAQLAAKEGQGKDVIPVPGYDAGGDTSPGDGGDMSDPSSQGMPAQPQDNMSPPQQGQTQPANDPQQSLKMYAMGAGAVPPDVADALEQHVDPQGTMDPSERKLLAVANAPPQAQFGLMQHYRQRFQALQAFARAAATGTQARPANISASTDAATRAFHNVPNGHSISFTPAGPGKVAVTMANYAGGDKSKQKSYDDGGPVEDTPTDADGAQSMGNVLPDPDNNSQGDDSSPQGEDQNSGVLPSMPSGADVGNAILGGVRAAGKVVHGTENAAANVTQKVMSIGQYLNMLKNNLYDAWMDMPPADALNKAANASWAGSINAPGMDNANTKEAGEDLVPQEQTSGMTIGAKNPQNPVATATAPVRGGAPSPSPGGTSGPVTIGGKQFPTATAARDYWLDQQNKFSQAQPAYNVNGKSPDQQRAEIEANYNAANDAMDAQSGGSHPVHATLPGFDPRIVAQANAMFPPSSPQWKDFIIKAQTGMLSAGQQQALAHIKGKYQVEAIQGKEGRIDNRASLGRAASQQRTNTIAGERGNASYANAINSRARSIMQATPNTSLDDAWKQAKIEIDGLGRQQAAPPMQPLQQPAPITGPIAVNPQTGQRMTVRNGQWVPIPAGQ